MSQADNTAGELRLLAVHAHPDDESSKGAATLAKYVSQGVKVVVATCTGGERGDVLNPKLDRPEIWENISEIRREEMAHAQAILGFEHEWLGFVDSGMPADELPDGCFAKLPVEEAAAPLVELVRRFRPHVIVTYDENGGYPHPDHIMCHKVSVAAFEAASNASLYPDAGEPWQPLKLYYHMGFSRHRFQALHDALLKAGLESHLAEWLSDDREDTWHRVTTQVECAEFFPQRDEALKAHATQVDPDGRWFAAPLAFRQEVWPDEDYELAKSHVDTTFPESDLFAGIDPQRDGTR